MAVTTDYTVYKYAGVASSTESAPMPTAFSGYAHFSPAASTFTPTLVLQLLPLQLFLLLIHQQPSHQLLWFQHHQVQLILTSLSPLRLLPNKLPSPHTTDLFVHCDLSKYDCKSYNSYL
jgi:hypothetical protein